MKVTAVQGNDGAVDGAVKLLILEADCAQDYDILGPIYGTIRYGGCVRLSADEGMSVNPQPVALPPPIVAAPATAKLARQEARLRMLKSLSMFLAGFGSGVTLLGSFLFSGWVADDGIVLPPHHALACCYALAFGFSAGVSVYQAWKESKRV